MCIIIVKKAGVELPDKEILKSAWNNNRDGAGYMYLNNKRVQIKKGFMDFNAFYNSLQSIKNSKDIPIILHLRITTHGGTSKANTHPFPLTSNEKLLKLCKVKTDIGIAHNGIIKINNDDDLSDTMQFIKDELSLFNVINPSWYKDIKALSYIEARIKSKLAIMDNTGYIATIGEFYEDDGVLYSNYSYIPYKNYYYDTWNYNSTYTVLTDYEEQLIAEMELLGLHDYEIDALLWEMDSWELVEILNLPDAKEKLLDRIYAP